MMPLPEGVLDVELIRARHLMKKENILFHANFSKTLVLLDNVAPNRQNQSSD